MKTTVHFEFSSSAYFDDLKNAVDLSIAQADKEIGLVAAKAREEKGDDATSSVENIVQFLKLGKLVLEKIQAQLSAVNPAWTDRVKKNGCLVVEVDKCILAALPTVLESIQKGIQETKSQLAKARHDKMPVTAALLSVTLVEAKEHLDMFSRVHVQLVAEGREAEK